MFPTAVHTFRTILTVLALANVCLAQTLQQWLGDPDSPLLSSEHLEAYIPKPLNPESTYAYDRFSPIETLNRVMRGRHPIVHERQQYMSEKELLELIDDHYKLGLAYFWSLGGIPRNLSLAFQHFEAGAQQGDPDAMFMVGVGYSTGYLGDDSPPRDPARATLYYTLAAEQGSLEAQLAMGYRHRFGIHTPVDRAAALHYYSKAGDTLLETLEDFHTESQWHYDHINKRTFAFGAELNTGLYGKHAYRKHISTNIDHPILLGEQSAAWRIVSMMFPDEFDDLEDAVETLYYRVQEEFDPTAMYALARIHAAGVDSSGPQWKWAVNYSRMCSKQVSFPAKQLIHVAQRDRVQSMCAEFLGERYLHGGEGVDQNITRARQWYKYAEKKANEYSIYRPKCASCASGLVLCDWVEAQANGTLPMNGSIVDIEKASDLFLTRFTKAFSQTQIVSDYTLPILLSKMYLYRGNTLAATDVLRKTVLDSFGNVPVASLMLAQIESGERQLNWYIQGIEAINELYSPLGFAHTSYDRGDIESTMLAFMIGSEIGIRSAALNLADLLDVRHSMLGTKYGHRMPWIRAISEWPIPAFVGNRVEKAAHYFAVAAIQGSVDALAKLVEYGWDYGLIPEWLNRWYLESLVASNFGMAQWSLGTLEYASRNYSQAMERFTRALVSPEAWLPVKFSQFLTSIHLLRDEGVPRVGSFWKRLKEAYQSMATFDPNLRGDTVRPFQRVFSKEQHENSQFPDDAIFENNGPQSLADRIFSTTMVAIIIVILSLVVVRILSQPRNNRN